MKTNEFTKQQIYNRVWRDIESWLDDGYTYEHSAECAWDYLNYVTTVIADQTGEPGGIANILLTPSDSDELWNDPELERYAPEIMRCLEEIDQQGMTPGNPVYDEMVSIAAAEELPIVYDGDVSWFSDEELRDIATREGVRRFDWHCIRLTLDNQGGEIIIEADDYNGDELGYESEKVMELVESIEKVSDWRLSYEDPDSTKFIMERNAE